MARRLVVGNWKMNGVAAQLDEVRTLAAAIRSEPPSARVVICPPATLLHRCAEIAQGSPLEVGAQDVAADGVGARTGDLAAEMLHDAGARWVILGHSERRDRHRESDALVAHKAAAAHRADLRPIICVGETAAERDSGEARAVVRAQVMASCPDEIGEGEYALAYEPIWAIGSGRIPAPNDIAAVHEAIASALRERFGAGAPAPVLYGGSVTAANAPSLFAVTGVGGLLVGGASLTAKAFLPIAAAG